MKALKVPMSGVPNGGGGAMKLDIICFVVEDK